MLCRASWSLLLGLALMLVPSMALAQDNDGDGYGVHLDPPDCDDNDPNRRPNIPEVCDGQDNDCLDETDELVDGDGDGASVCGGDCDDTDELINANDLDGDGFSPCTDDCNDEDPTIGPFDNDGDGLEGCGATPDCDDTDPAANYDDADADGQSACDGDCDDADPDINVLAEEVCGDGADNDCNGTPDDVDEDGDGAVSPDCDGDDCDDNNASINPNEDAAAESGAACNDGIDNDCDETIDNLDENCFEEPEVDAGDDQQEAYLGGRVVAVLDATGSSDANFGDELTYTWTLDTAADAYPGVSVELISDPADAIALLAFSAEPDTELSQWDFDLHVVVSDGVFSTEADVPEAKVRATFFRPAFYSSARSCNQGASSSASLAALLLLGLGALVRRRN